MAYISINGLLSLCLNCVIVIFIVSQSKEQLLCKKERENITHPLLYIS